MPDLFSHEPETANPDEICRQAFSRCSNWPTERAGQLGLAQDLKRASDRYGVSQEAITARCSEVSSFCPTGHDIMVQAQEMAGAQRRAAEPTMVQQRAALERECGPAQPFDWQAIDRKRGEAARGRRDSLWAKLRSDPRAKRNGQWAGWFELSFLAAEFGYPEYAKAWKV